MHAQKREDSGWVGRVPFGWTVRDKRLVPDPAEQRVLRDAARRFVNGETLSAIAERHGLLVSPLSRMLASERVQDALPPRLAASLAAAIATRRMSRVPTSSQSLLGGLASCGVCGRGMVLSSTRGGRPQGRWWQ
jgi:hypothetical protein